MTGAALLALVAVGLSAGKILAVGDDQTIPDWMADHMRAHMGTAAADQMHSMMGTGSMMSGSHGPMMSGSHGPMMSGSHGPMMGPVAPESGE
jgi:hypothetical protein